MRFILLTLLVAGPALAQEASFQCMRRVGTVLNVEYWWSKANQADAGTPIERVPEFLESPGFSDRWAAFLNSRFNAQPGLTGEDDVMTFVVRYVLDHHKPWRDVYVGRFAVSGPSGYPKITEDPTRPPYGFFGLRPWLVRYAGNDTEGRMLQAAYRILRATIGLELVPSPQNAAGDSTLTGRARPECRSCHFDSPYALDHVAGLLPWYRKGIGSRMTLEAQAPTPAPLFDGRQVHSLEELLAIAVDSDAFHFWSCRLAFEFAVGRPETGCEAPVFDACVDALRQTGDLRAALAAILQHPSYCAELWP
ncbi:MAG: hypothetical protein ACOZQL_00585 [Myxococcota bacterium]